MRCPVSTTLSRGLGAHLRPDAPNGARPLSYAAAIGIGPGAQAPLAARAIATIAAAVGGSSPTAAQPIQNTKPSVE